MGRLDGRVALITGAASGIGEACALRFAQEGAAIAGVDVVEPSGQGWKAVASAARDAATFKADVRDEAEVREAVSAAHRHFGRFDVLV
ncbi:MAG: SDR family NAD(P)-dependent oxidoreductase, partial [bacterium]|nr:SDR family NAD(P)-dependent oxidoreductase [bacterium]